MGRRSARSRRRTSRSRKGNRSGSTFPRSTAARSHIRRGNDMINRRTILSGALVSGLALIAGAPAWAQAPAPYEPNQEMIDAAKKEGSIVWYTATDVQVSEKVGSAFEAKYPGI